MTIKIKERKSKRDDGKDGIGHKIKRETQGKRQKEEN